MAKATLRRRIYMFKNNPWRYDDPYFYQTINPRKRTLRKPKINKMRKNAILQMQMMILSNKSTPDITKL